MADPAAASDSYLTVDMTFDGLQIVPRETSEREGPSNQVFRRDSIVPVVQGVFMDGIAAEIAATFTNSYLRNDAKMAIGAKGALVLKKAKRTDGVGEPDTAVRFTVTYPTAIITGVEDAGVIAGESAFRVTWSAWSSDGTIANLRQLATA